MVNRARKGIFNQFEIQRGLTIQMMMKYFTQSGSSWQIKDEIKNMADFKFANFLDNISFLGTFDIVFCRNVLIYFNAETKATVLNKISKQLDRDGVLFLGACETIMRLDVPYKPVPGHHGIFSQL